MKSSKCVFWHRLQDRHTRFREQGARAVQYLFESLDRCNTAAESASAAAAAAAGGREVGGGGEKEGRIGLINSCGATNGVGVEFAPPPLDTLRSESKVRE